MFNQDIDTLERLSPTEVRNELTEVFTPLCAEVYNRVTNIPPEMLRLAWNALSTDMVSFIHTFNDELLFTDESGEPVHERRKAEFADPETQLLWTRHLKHLRLNAKLVQPLYPGPVAIYEKREYLCQKTYSQNAIVSSLITYCADTGIEFARRISSSTAFLVTLTQILMQNISSEQFVKYPNTIFLYTARGRDLVDDKVDLAALFEQKDPYIPTLSSLQEGIVTTHQALCMALAVRNPRYDGMQLDWYEKPHTIMSDLITEGIPAKLARTLIPGVIGPLTLSGRYLPDLLSDDLSSKNTFSKSFIRNAREAQENYAGEVGRNFAGCPVSKEQEVSIITPDGIIQRRTSGEQLIAETLLYIFNALNFDEKWLPITRRTH